MQPPAPSVARVQGGNDVLAGLNAAATIAHGCEVPLRVALAVLPEAIWSSSIENVSVPREVNPEPAVVPPAPNTPIATTRSPDVTAKFPVAALVPFPDAAAEPSNTLTPESSSTAMSV